MIAQIVVFSRKTDAQRKKNFAFRSAKIAQKFCEWKPYFKFHLSFSYMLVINFIFYPNYFIICFKSSFSILKTSIFCPLKFILVPKSRKKFKFHKMIFRPIVLVSIPNFHFLSKKPIFFSNSTSLLSQGLKVLTAQFYFFVPIILFFFPIISFCPNNFMYFDKI